MSPMILEMNPCTKLGSAVGDPAEEVSGSSMTSATTMGCTGMVEESASMRRKTMTSICTREALAVAWLTALRLERYMS